MAMGGGKQTSTTNTVSEPPAFLKPFLQTGVTELEALHKAQPTAPDMFPGQMTAPFAPATEAALGLQEMRALMGSPLTGAAQGQLTDTMGGKYLNPLMNENFQGGLEAAFRPIAKTFSEVTLPGITGQFGMGGRYGGGLMGDTIERATDDLTRNFSDSAVKAASDLYGQERQNQMFGMKYAPELAQQDYYDINQLGAAGTIRQAQDQALIDESVRRYDYDQTKDLNWQNAYLQMLQGAYPGGTSTGTSTQRGGPSGFQSALGTGLSLASLAFPFIRSDARVKENIEPVGELNNGLPVYVYNYKGDPTPQIGLLAQDVREVKPDAVADFGGLLMVDYAKATRAD